MSNSRDFKGVWIPKEIWLNPDLLPLEKLFLAEIDSLDNDNAKGCFASNEYFGQFFRITEGSAANIISGLKKRGYVFQVFFDGRNRGLRVHPNVKAGFMPDGSRFHLEMKAGFTHRGKQVSRKNEHNNTINNKENTKEGGKNAQNALTPPFTKTDEIEIPETVFPLEAEKKEKDLTGGAGPGGAMLVTTFTPQDPYTRVVEMVTPGPQTPGDITKPGRRSNVSPTIHPENVAAFEHFSDPEKCRMMWGEWIEYKWGQHRDKYKTAKSELVMLRKLYTWSQGQAEIVSQIIEKSVGNLYKGLIDPNEKKGNGTEKRHDLNPAQRQHLTLAQYVAQRRIDAENRNAME
jgi:hypothetical protein